MINKLQLSFKNKRPSRLTENELLKVIEDVVMNEVYRREIYILDSIYNFDSEEYVIAEDMTNSYHPKIGCFNESKIYIVAQKNMKNPTYLLHVDSKNEVSLHLDSVSKLEHAKIYCMIKDDLPVDVVFNYVRL